jgi:hypothetical protein
MSKLLTSPTCKSTSTRFSSLCHEILYQMSLSRLKHQCLVVHYPPDTRSRYEHCRGQDQAQARLSDDIRQTGLCSTMPSHSRACTSVDSRIYHLHPGCLQIMYDTGLWVFLLQDGSERFWNCNIFCVQSVFPLLEWLRDSTEISLHDIMVGPRWCLC